MPRGHKRQGVETVPEIEPAEVDAMVQQARLPAWTDEVCTDFAELLNLHHRHGARIRLTMRENARAVEAERELRRWAGACRETTITSSSAHAVALDTLVAAFDALKPRLRLELGAPPQAPLWDEAAYLVWVATCHMSDHSSPPRTAER